MAGGGNGKWRHWLFQTEEIADADIRSKREQGRVWGEKEDTGEITRHEVDLS